MYFQSSPADWVCAFITQLPLIRLYSCMTDLCLKFPDYHACDQKIILTKCVIPFGAPMRLLSCVLPDVCYQFFSAYFHSQADWVYAVFSYVSNILSKGFSCMCSMMMMMMSSYKVRNTFCFTLWDFSPVWNLILCILRLLESTQAHAVLSNKAFLLWVMLWFYINPSSGIPNKADSSLGWDTPVLVRSPKFSHMHWAWLVPRWVTESEYWVPLTRESHVSCAVGVPSLGL